MGRQVVNFQVGPGRCKGIHEPDKGRHIDRAAPWRHEPDAVPVAARGRPHGHANAVHLAFHHACRVLEPGNLAQIEAAPAEPRFRIPDTDGRAFDAHQLDRIASGIRDGTNAKPQPEGETGVGLEPRQLHLQQECEQNLAAYEQAENMHAARAGEGLCATARFHSHPPLLSVSCTGSPAVSFPYGSIAAMSGSTPGAGPPKLDRGLAGRHHLPTFQQEDTMCATVSIFISQAGGSR